MSNNFDLSGSLLEKLPPPTAGVNQIVYEEFLRWCKSRTDLFANASIRILELDQKSIFRSSVELIDGNQIEKIYGCGRDEDPKLSLVKAYAEAIERLVFRSTYYSEITTANLTIDNSLVGRKISPTSVRLPPRDLITSNGWAAHFEADQAIQNSYKELFERHILLYTFFKFGWSGFEIEESTLDKKWIVHSLLSKCSFNSMKAGVVAVQSQKHLGKTFGHFAEQILSIEKSKKWVHALCESLEPAILFNSLERSDIEKLRISSKDWLEKIQFDALLMDWNFSGQPTSRINYSDLNVHESGLLIFDLMRPLNMPVPFYVTFVFNDQLIPLFSKRYLKDSSKGYLEQILHRYDITLNEVPEVHPFA